MVKLTEELVLARSRASDLESIRKLNCWGNELTDVSIIKQLPNVQVVTLSVNKISTLSHFASCTNLEELYIRKNNIKDLAEILHLTNLPNLRVLWLADNPCASSELYRPTVLRHLPCLKKLDNITVQPDEVNQALLDGIELTLPDPSLVTLASGEGEEDGAVGDVSAYAVGDGDDDAETEPREQLRELILADSDNVGGQSRDESNVTLTSEPATLNSQARQSTNNPFVMSWEETNKIRTQLGLRPLPVEKVVSMKPRSVARNKERNANILQAVLHLVNELDADSVEVVLDALRNRQDMLRLV